MFSTQPSSVLGILGLFVVGEETTDAKLRVTVLESCSCVSIIISFGVLKVTWFVNKRSCSARVDVWEILAVLVVRVGSSCVGDVMLLLLMVAGVGAL